MEVQLSTIDLVRLQKGVKTVGCRSRWFNQEISLHRLIVYDRMTERRLSRLRSLVTGLPAPCTWAWPAGALGQRV